MYIGNDLQVAESGNKIIDDISSSFNGSTTSFALLVGGAAPVPFPINTQQIYISVNGVIQEPDPTGSAGFKLLGNNIVFSSAPANGHAFFGVILSGADYVTVGTEFPAGSATAPSITFGNDNNTGLFSVTGGTMGFTSDGTQTFTMDGNGFNFPDNKKVNLGSSSDLSIYHDGSNSYIKDTGTGYAVIAGSAVNMTNAAVSENMFMATADGSVDLYYNGTKRFETTNTGTNVIGIHVDDGATHDGDVTFTGAAANVVWDKSADDLIFYDNAKAAFGTSSDLQIYHDGTNNYLKGATASQHVIIEANSSEIQLRPVSGETGIKVIHNGAVELYYDNSKKLQTNSSGIQPFGNVDIQSAGHVLLEDNGKVQLGNSQDLQILHTGSTNVIRCDNSMQLHINKTDTENMAKFIPDGAVELYYDNSKKFETYSGGCIFQGNIKADQDNATLILGAGSDLQLWHDGTNNIFYSDAPDLYIKTTSSETCARFGRNGGVDLYFDNSKKLSTTSTGVKIESSSNTTLHLTSSTSSSASIEFGDTDDDDEAEIWYDNYSKKLNFRTTEASDLVFYRNGTEKTRITSDGLTFNGDTAAANALDDYEEGTFTAAITVASGTNPSQNAYTHRYAYYRKIGKMVHFRVDVEFGAISQTGSGNAVVSGLPYANSNQTFSYGMTFSAGYNLLWGTDNFPTQAYINPNTTEMYLMQNTISDGDEYVQASGIQNGTRLICGGTYMTDS